MTDYDHWPPIRFRFFGDENQAKGRIPQARSLMAQLIRRMEGQERDNGQWQVQAEDGTQFRVTKMGDVHVADIFGVTPSVKPPAQIPVPISGVDYGRRDDVIPINDGVAIPETAIPPIPDAPHINPREILMRPHGEAFSAKGSYLWIGAKVLLPEFNEDTHPFYYDGIASVEVKKEFTSSLSVDGELRPYADEFKKYFGILEGWSWEAYRRDSITISQDDRVPVPILPDVNLILYEPNFGKSEAAKVLQSVRHANDGQSWGLLNNTYDEFSGVTKFEDSYSLRPTLDAEGLSWIVDEYYDIAIDDGGWSIIPPPKTTFAPIKLLFALSYLPNGYPPRVESEFTGQFLDGGEITSIMFQTAISTTGNGAFTVFQKVYKYGEQFDAHGFVAVGAPKDNEIEISKENTYSIDSRHQQLTHYTILDQKAEITDRLSPCVGDGQYWSYNLIQAGGYVKLPYLVTLNALDSYFEGISSGYTYETIGGGITKYWRTHNDEAQVVYTANINQTAFSEDDATVITNTVASIPAEHLPGIYELRLSAGWFQFPDTDYWNENPVDCEVYIDVGGLIRTYTVSLNMADYSKGQGLFNAAQWESADLPTTIDDKWYTGCWLIDIDSKTIIHETDPGKLDRPWFTTE